MLVITRGYHFRKPHRRKRETMDVPIPRIARTRRLHIVAAHQIAPLSAGLGGEFQHVAGDASGREVHGLSHDETP